MSVSLDELQVTKSNPSIEPAPKVQRQVGAQSDLLGLLIQEQSELSAVEVFSLDQAHFEVPAQQQYYKKLLPATPLLAGEQFAFQVDLDRCSGCKACVTACHSLNGLDETEAWRDVGYLHGETSTGSMLQHVTSACHHCVEPACMIGCPTNAYTKDPVTGIVKHLDDQCFGCQYCTLTCPYGVPKYHEKKGIVRKCDMCTNRLDVGEAPACVQACPHEAIAITKVRTAEMERRTEEAEFLPKAHQPGYTKPTTVYLNKEKLGSNVVAGDEADLTPEHAHWPLVAMLVLTQVSVGLYLVDFLLRMTHGDQVSPLLSLIAFLVGQGGMAGATLHLGRPLYAFRGILGITHSWLSREIAVFGAFAALTGAYSGACFVSVWFPQILQLLPGFMVEPLPWLIPFFGFGTVMIGLLGIYCSVMIYVYTQRVPWGWSSTAGKFFLLPLVAGPLASTAVFGVEQFVIEDSFGGGEFVMATLVVIGVVAAASKLALELRLLRHRRDQSGPQRRAALKLTRPLKPVLVARISTTIAGCLLAGVALFPSTSIVSAALFVVAAALVLAGETMERVLFFKGVVANKMPGGLR